MKIFNDIENNVHNFKQLCEKHSVIKLYAFGSSVTGNFDELSSDIDLIVEINEVDPVEKGEKLMSLWGSFEKLFQRKVDLLTESSINNPYLKASIESTKKLIYDGSRKKVFI